MKKILSIGLKRIAPPVVEQFLNPLCLFIITPMMINKTGGEIYSQWIFLITLVSFSQILCLGCTAFLSKTVAELNALGDKKAIQDKVSNLFFIILFCFSVVFFVVVSVGYIVPNKTTIDFTFFFIVIICGLFQEMDNMLSSLLKGYEKFSLSCIFESLSRLAWITVIIAGIYHGDVLKTTSLAFFTKFIIKYSLVYIFFEKKWIFPKYNKSEIKKLMLESRWMWVQLMGGVSLGLFDRLVIPLVISMNKLSSYVPCLQLSQLPFTVVAAANQILMPMFARYNMQGRYPNKWFFKISIASIVSSLPCLMLLFLGHYILKIWIGSVFSHDNSYILDMLVVNYLLLSAMTPFHFLLLGLGRSKFVANLNLFAGILLSFSTYAAAHYGVYAVACVKIIYPIIQTAYVGYSFVLYKKSLL